MEDPFLETTTDLFSFVTDGTYTEYSSTDNIASGYEEYFSSTFKYGIISPKNETRSMKSQLAVYDFLIPLLGSLIIITNGAVIVSSGLLLKKGQQPRCTYLLLGNVAMADLLTGCAVITGQLFPKHKRDLTICSLQLGTIVASTVVSIYSVGLIAADRFIYIVHGMQYSRWIYPTRARIIIAATWCIGLFVGFLPAVFHGETDNGRICWFIMWAPPKLIVFTTIVGIAPVALVCVLYSIILYHAVKKVIQLKKIGKAATNEDITDTTRMRIFRGGSKAITTISENVNDQDQCEENDATPTEPQANTRIDKLRNFCKRKPKEYNKVNKPIANKKSNNPSKWKAIKVVFFTTGSFVATWVPYFVACSCYVFCDSTETPQRCAKLKYAIASPLAILGFVNSLLNPVIYAWWHKGFRKSMKMMCCRKKKNNMFTSRHPQVAGKPSTSQSISSAKTSSQIASISTTNSQVDTELNI